MKPKFIPLTRHEMFFGIAPKSNLSTGGSIKSIEMISKAAAAPINEPYIPPTPNFSINTDVIAKQQIGFMLRNFLWKYRGEIGLGIGIGILAGLIIHHSTKDNEDEKIKSNWNGSLNPQQ